MATKKKMLQAAAGNAGGAALDITDVFSTYLYEGTGSGFSITNGVDLTEGGLVWMKRRDISRDHALYDTERGVGRYLRTNLANGQDADNGTAGVRSFNSDGFTLGSNDTGENDSGGDYASWTFRKAPKFFDVVTYTGDGTDERDIAHNLGGPVGCLMVKCTSEAADWQVLHKDANRLILNSTAAQYSVANTAARFGDDVTITRPTSTHFTVSTPGNADTNKSGATYVAYLFAHNDGDGEFGPSGDQDIIKCGSYTGNGSTNGPEIDLGWEPQWLLVKPASVADNWTVYDNMRGLTAKNSADFFLYPNSTAAESNNNFIVANPRGFSLEGTNQLVNGSGQTYIYIAIRRGPLAPPESGTEVFAVDTRNGTSPSPPLYTSGFVVDAALERNVSSSGSNILASRMTGQRYLLTDSTSAELAAGAGYQFDYNDGWYDGTSTNSSVYSWMFRRAPGFFDVVAYTGDGVAGRTVSHNLGVAPELIIVKNRTYNGSNWIVWCDQLTRVTEEPFMILNGTNGKLENNAYWNNGAHTDSVFETGSNLSVNGSGYSHIAYLFATLPGVSKVGSYTGNGSSQTIDCGFTSGARFILIKRTDSTGDWYVWDTTRGIVAGNDPHLSLNTTTAEVTSDDSIDPDNSGFIVNQVSATNINVSSAEYIFYAIA